MVNPEQYARVALAGPLKKTFTYRVPAEIGPLVPGQRVLVPFGRSRKVGFYLGAGQPGGAFEIKNIVRAFDDTSFFSDELFRFCIWMAEYYFANPADCLAAVLPSVMRSSHGATLIWNIETTDMLPGHLKSTVRKGKKLSQATIARIKQSHSQLLRKLIEENIVREEWLTDKLENQKKIIGFRADKTDNWQEFFKKKKFNPEYFDGTRSRAELVSFGWSYHYLRAAVREGLLAPVYDDRVDEILEFVKPRDDVAAIKLTAEQERVSREIIGHLRDGFQTFLIHGITGSGKTIVYCHIAREVLQDNKTVLVLTPEISLSGAILAYFRGFFGSEVTVIHSAMTERERFESWQGIKNGVYRVVVGPRSALFAPLVNPGLIIVDEEHDGSYKQDEPAPRFHGRDAAIMRAKIHNIPIILGSASPSLEAYHHAREGHYRLLELTERPGGATLPVVRVIDMRRERLKGDLPYLSFSLKKEIENRLELGQQVILFLNRRGYSPQLKCAECGHMPACPSCQVSLTYHRAGNKLSCHYCGYVRYEYSVCEKCGGNDFYYPGVGTQKVEENIPRLFPKARVVRFDSDTASGRRNSYRILADFANRKYDLLLGTQMVTKGLDLPGVTLVGVLSADLGLDMPDFRATEKTFARLLQVAGRSGRSELRGQVLIQTYYAESDLIDDAARQDYISFYEREIESRREAVFPPFVRLVNFIFSGADDVRLTAEALQFRDRLLERVRKTGLKITPMGPAPCPIQYLRKNYRRHMFVKTCQIQKFTRLLTAWEEETPRFGLSSTVKVTVDVDPDDMM
ncbi:MAG: replication restart helicase PriA [Candidatus Zixiibacteriota bacterium]